MAADSWRVENSISQFEFYFRLGSITISQVYCTVLYMYTVQYMNAEKW